MGISITECRGSANWFFEYDIDIDGTTTLTTTVTPSPQIVHQWIRTTLRLNSRRNNLVVGLGVQWRPPSYRGEETPAAVLLLCVGRRCLIFQLLRSPNVPNILHHFLLNPSHTFVGLWNHSDRRKLLDCSEHRLAMGQDPVDLRHYAVSNLDGRGLGRETRETIVWECLGLEVDFDLWVARSNWEADVLQHDQIIYASADAYCSFLLGKNMRIWEICTE